MHRIQGILTTIQGNIAIYSVEYHHFNIPFFNRFQGRFERVSGNVQKDSGECSRRFWGMFEKALGNVTEDSRECYRVGGNGTV